jgi:hypothetical protein
MPSVALVLVGSQPDPSCLCGVVTNDWDVFPNGAWIYWHDESTSFLFGIPWLNPNPGIQNALGGFV